MTITQIVLSVGTDQNIYATFKGPDAAEIVRLFGTATIPTPFTSQTPNYEQRVPKVLQAENPGTEIVWAA